MINAPTAAHGASPAARAEEITLASAACRYHNPVAIRFGSGAIDELPDVLGARRAVLVTFPEAEDLGLVARLRSILGSALVAVEDRIEPNPNVSYLAAMYERFWRDHGACEAVVAVGGGSAIDTAKALIVGTASGRFDDLVALLATGKPFVLHRVKALVAVPTTAGTGSEVTPWATVWDRAAGKKHCLHLRETWPQTAIVDPRHRIEAILARPLALFEQLQLEAQFLDCPRQLSGGQQQRVAIARAFAARPDLLVCDEVTSALDVSVQAQVLSLLRDMQQRSGAASLFISHDLGVIRQVAPRVVVLRNGVVCDSGATQAVFQRPTDDYTRRLIEAASRGYANLPDLVPA